MNQYEVEVYLTALENALEKKDKILEKLCYMSGEQKELFKKEIFDVEYFDSLVEQKQQLLLQLEQIDDGFTTAYHKISLLLKEEKVIYKKQINRLQEKITQITNRAIGLQVIEKEVNGKFTLYLQQEKNKVKTFKMNKQRANSYYKNMANQHYNQSYFIDQKK